MNIRPCEARDLARVNEIYNHYVRTTPATFDIDELSMEGQEEWFTHYGTTGRFRAFVADSDGVVGYATSSPFATRRAYETSVTVTIYLAPDCGGRGIGTELYAALFDAVKDEDIHRAYAGITIPNDASVALHEKFGFRQAGYYTEQGRKFGRYWDVALFEKEME